MEAAMIVVG